MNSIKCERRIYNFKISTHSHGYGQLILPLQGALYIETEHKKLKLKDDSLFFLPPNCQHSFNADNNNEFLVLDIPDKMLNKCDMNNLYGGRDFLFDERWKAIRSLLIAEMGDRQSSVSIHNLFFYFYKFLTENNLSNSLKYINEHFTENVDLKTLAEIEHYNISYYSEWFKYNMKLSPTEYIQNLRVEKAKELLLNTDLTILQIAQMVGYEHNSSFTKVFKNLEKVSPIGFRRNTKK